MPLDEAGMIGCSPAALQSIQTYSSLPAQKMELSRSVLTLAAVEDHCHVLACASGAAVFSPAPAAPRAASRFDHGRGSEHVLQARQADTPQRRRSKAPRVPMRPQLGQNLPLR